MSQLVAGHASERVARTSKQPATTWHLRMAIVGMAMVGFTGVRVGEVTIADGAFLVTTAMVTAKLLTHSGRRGLAPAIARRNPPFLIIGMVLISVGALGSTFMNSLSPLASALALARLWYIIFVWFWTLRSVCRNWDDLIKLLRAWVLGAVLNGLVGVYQEVSGANAVAPNWGRSPGLTAHINALGIATAATVPLLIMWRSRATSTPRSKRRDRSFKLAAIVVLLAGSGVSGSITAIAAALLGVGVTIVTPWLLQGSAQTRRMLLPAIGGLLAALVIVSSGLVSGVSALARFDEFWQNDSGHVASSVDTREDLTSVAIDRILISPFAGVGLDANSARIATAGPGSGLPVHSLYLRVAYEAGAVAFIGLMLMQLSAADQIVRLARHLRHSPYQWIPIGLLGCSVAFFFDAMSSTALYDRYFWAPLGLAGAAFGIAKAQARAPAPARTSSTDPLQDH